MHVFNIYVCLFLGTSQQHIKTQTKDDTNMLF